MFSERWRGLEKLEQNRAVPNVYTQRKDIHDNATSYYETAKTLMLDLEREVGHSLTCEIQSSRHYHMRVLVKESLTVSNYTYSLLSEATTAKSTKR